MRERNIAPEASPERERGKLRTLYRALGVLCLDLALTTIPFGGVNQQDAFAESPPQLRESSVELAESSALAKVCAGDKIDIIAHRGSGTDTITVRGVRYTENTIPAFRLAIRRGADGFEADYWPTAPNTQGERFVISNHDPTLNRTTSGTGRVKERSMSYIDRQHADSGADIPIFDKVQKNMSNYARNVIGDEIKYQQEIKNWPTGPSSRELLSEMIETDKALIPDVYENVLVTSGERKLLAIVNDIDPNIRTGLINFSRTHRPDIYKLPRWIDMVMLNYDDVDRRYVRKAHRNGYQVSARNVDNLRRLRHAVDIGVDQAVTNNINLC